MEWRGAVVPFLEEDDPRGAEMSADEQALAAGLLEAPARWHRGGADWLAVELQYGRGVPVAELARSFGVSTSQIYVRSRGQSPAVAPWVAALTEEDRRELARLVWDAGDKRGALKNTEEARRLYAASEWRPLARAAPMSWRAKHRAGEARGVKFEEGGFGEGRDGGRVGEGGAGERGWFAGGCYGADDPRRAERLVMRERINALLAGLDDAAAAACGGDGAAEMAGEPGGVGDAGGGGDDLAGVGGMEAAGAGWELADVDDDGRARVGQDAGGGGVGARARGERAGGARGSGGADAA